MKCNYFQIFLSNSPKSTAGVAAVIEWVSEGGFGGLSPELQKVCL